MKNKLYALFGYLLLIVGLLSLFSPIPGAIFLLAGGLTILICADPSARFCLKWMRTNISWFNKMIFWVEAKIGSRVKFMGDALKLTHPSKDENDKTLSHKEYLKKNMDQDKNK